MPRFEDVTDRMGVGSTRWTLAAASADFNLQTDPLTQNRYSLAGGVEATAENVHIYSLD